MFDHVAVSVGVLNMDEDEPAASAPSGDSYVAPPASPHPRDRRWVLKLRFSVYGDYYADVGTSGEPRSLDLTAEQGPVVGRILSLLQLRKGLAPGIELPLDALAIRELAGVGVAPAESGFMTHALLTEESAPPSAGPLKRRAIFIPLLLFMLLGVSGLAIFFTPQGKDMILSAEEGPLEAVMVGIALVAVPGALVAALFKSLADASGQAEFRTAVRDAAEGPAAFTAIWGVLVAAILSAVSFEPFGWRDLAFFLGFGAFSFAMVIGFTVLMGFPRASALLACIVLLLIGIWPAEAGVRLGSPLVLTATLSSWAVLLSALAYWYRRASTVVWFGATLTMAVFASLLFRVFVGMPPDTMRGVPRAKAGTAILDAYDEIGRQQPGRPPVIVIVAAAGGGIKASYWTAKVLGHATDEAPLLGRAMLAASGVSGGSLGLSLYRSLLAVGAPDCDGPENVGPFERCAIAFHRYDLLAGLIGALTTTEVLNSLVPILPRRSVALERTWEVRWRDTVRAADGQPAGDRMAQPFASLWPGNRGTPALVLNATRPLTGDRVVVSNLDVSGVLTPRSACGANIAEQLDLPLSTAANASARFPVVEEWGWFKLQRSIEGCDAKRREAIADGGFFDNSGAATALDLYWRLKKLTKGAEHAPRIIVVQISSEVDCRLAIAVDGNHGRAGECADGLKERRRLSEVWQPKGAFFSREWRAIFSHNADLKLLNFFYPSPDEKPSPPGLLGTASNAVSVTGLAVASQLCDDVTAAGDDYFHFSLAGALDIPLGWSLSRHARSQIDRQLSSGTNRHEMDRLVRLLRTSALTPSAAASPKDTSPTVTTVPPFMDRRGTCAKRYLRS
jgi:hypothetical protein